jgi:hypothetical protein
MTLQSGRIKIVLAIIHFIKFKIILKLLPINYLEKIIFGKKIIEQRKLCVLIEKNPKHFSEKKLPKIGEIH